MPRLKPFLLRVLVVALVAAVVHEFVGATPKSCEITFGLQGTQQPVVIELHGPNAVTALRVQLQHEPSELHRALVLPPGDYEGVRIQGGDIRSNCRFSWPTEAAVACRL